MVPVRLETNEAVEVSIFGLGLNEPIKCLAHVVWCLPLEGGRFCAGLEFHRKLLITDLLKISPSSGPSLDGHPSRSTGVGW